MITRRTLSLADARNMAEAAEAEAIRRGIHVSIAICDDAGHLLWFQRMDGVPLLSVTMAPEKARMAAIGRQPTKLFQQMIDGGMFSLAAAPAMQGALEGGVPVVFGGEVVGAIAAAGGSGEDDAAIAGAGASALQIVMDGNGDRHSEPAQGMPGVCQDRQDIIDVFNRYAAALDLRRWEELADLFVEEVTANFAETVRLSGRDDVVGLIRRAIEACGATHHLLSNHIAYVRGDRAEASCYIRAYHSGRGEFAGQFEESLGIFDTSMVRTGSTWRFSRFDERIYVMLGTQRIFGISENQI